MRCQCIRAFGFFRGLAATALLAGCLLPSIVQAQTENQAEAGLTAYKQEISLHQNQQDYAGALAAAQALVSYVQEELGEDHREYARAIQLRGFAKENTGDLTGAESDLSRSVVLAAAAVGSDHPAVLAFRSTLASFYQDNGFEEQALELLPALLAEHETRYGFADGATLRMAIQLAQMRSAMGDVTEASRLYQRILDVMKASRAADDEAVIETVREYAAHLRLNTQFSRAAQLLSSAYDDVSGRSDYHAFARRKLDYAFGLLYMDWGLFPDAERNFRQALEGQTQEQGEAFFTPLNGLAASLVRQERNDEARRIYERLLPMLADAQGRGVATGVDFSGMRNNLLVTYRKLGLTDQTRALSADLLAELEQSGGGLDGDSITDTQVLMLQQAANLLIEAGEYQRAGQVVYRVIEAAERSADVSQKNKLALQQQLTQIIVSMGELEAALPLMRDLYYDRPAMLGTSHRDGIEAAMNLTHLLLRLNDTSDEAKRVAEAAVGGIFSSEAGSLRLAQADDSAGSRRDIGYVAAYQMLLEAVWREVDRSPSTLSYNQYAGLEAIQRIMLGESDIAIAQMTATRAAASRGGELGQAIEQRLALQSRWQVNQQARDALIGASSAQHVARRTALEAIASNLAGEYRAIDAELKSDFPEYFDYISPEPLHIEAAAELLGPDEAVVLLAPYDFGTHVILVTNDSEAINWHKSALNSRDIDDSVRELRLALDQQIDSYTGEYEVPYNREVAYELYQELIEPLLPSLKGKTHLFVAASGSLSSLPLSVLVTNPPQGDEFDMQAMRDTAWLADSFALVQIPSLQSLQMLRRLRDERVAAGSAQDASQRRVFDGFGDPSLAPVDEEAARGALVTFNAVFAQGQRGANGALRVSQEKLRSLPSLPGTALELEAIRQALDAPRGSVRTGMQATEMAVKTADLTQTEILLFATHGLLAGEINGFSEPGLVMTPPDEAGIDDDGLLSASDIAGLSLNADWVILSACNTAAGNSSGAPGLSGLARAFFRAGAQNLLASHWPVRDDLAPEITTQTIKLSRSGDLTRAQAFAQAIREVRLNIDDDTRAHPAAWAPFVLVGDR